VENAFESQRISCERIIELQEKLEAAECELKTNTRHLQAEISAKESELVALKNQVEQQRGLTLQVGRQKDEAIERRMQLESAMLQLKISLKLLAESWGCDTSLVSEAEDLVALLSQVMKGKSNQKLMQAVQGVMNSTWLEVTHMHHPGKTLPGDPVVGIRMIHESVKALNMQNAMLLKNLKEAKGQVAEQRQELEKWKRARASVIPSWRPYHYVVFSTE
jgi:hypothetical protein